ncbi:hypothetical protein, partial [Aquimarina aquimarini]|uniref:hypothetical protein n=1 Tax=Aquimarina aquimarini TaxID=1191734 RepID=UPI00131F0F7B
VTPVYTEVQCGATISIWIQPCAGRTSRTHHTNKRTVTPVYTEIQYGATISIWIQPCAERTTRTHHTN